IRPDIAQRIGDLMNETARAIRKEQPPPRAPNPFDVRLIRLRRYLSREDWVWLWLQDRTLARRRWRWCFLEFMGFCRELAIEQRRISRERSKAQCDSVGRLLRTELRVYVGIAGLVALGVLHFAGVRYDNGAIMQRFRALNELMHPT